MTILGKERLIVHDMNLKNPNTYNRLSQMAYTYTEFCYLQNTGSCRSKIQTDHLLNVHFNILHDVVYFTPGGQTQDLFV